jgi:hypothetical protein
LVAKSSIDAGFWAIDGFDAMTDMIGTEDRVAAGQ